MPAPTPINRAASLNREPATDARLPRLQEHVADLEKRLQAVADGPSVETVHRLRTGTRRAGALLQSLLSGRRPSHASRKLQQSSGKLLRQWQKLRRAAGNVRDLDVHRQLLAKMRKSWTAPAADPAQALLVDQLDNLDAWLKHEREQRAEQLRRQAKKSAPKTAELIPEVLAALAATAPRQAKDARRQLPAALALDDFFRTSYAMPALDCENLHDFRKQTKEARYVAEAGGAEPHAIAVASALQRIQDAIGGWHDLDALQHEAAEALGDKGAELAALLAEKAAQQFEQAVAITERQRRRLLGERLAMQAQSRKRKPPAAAIVHAGARRAVR